MDISGSRLFVTQMVERFPELAPLLAEHQTDNFGETLPHVFMGDVTRWFVTAFRAGRSEDAAALVGWLDAQYPALPPDAQNVIDVSFLESLPWPPDRDADSIKQLLPPRLAAELTAAQNWRPTE